MGTISDSLPLVDYVTTIPQAPIAVGPYSPATICNGFAFLSGQIPINPASGTIVDGTIEVQTRQVLSNITAVLNHLGLTFHHVVKTTIFLTDLKNFSEVNSIYSEIMGEAKPARSTIQVAALPLGAEIEIECIAALPLGK